MVVSIIFWRLAEYRRRGRLASLISARCIYGGTSRAPRDRTVCSRSRFHGAASDTTLGLIRNNRVWSRHCSTGATIWHSCHRRVAVSSAEISQSVCCPLQSWRVDSELGGFMKHAGDGPPNLFLVVSCAHYGLESLADRECSDHASSK